MADPIRVVDSVAPLPRAVKDQRRSREDKKNETPKDQVSLSHPGDKRTLKLLLQILSDSLGHSSISEAARANEATDQPERIAAFVLQQINVVLVTPFLSMGGSATADEFSEYVQKIQDRLELGKNEARSVFKSLETASEKHLEYVDTVGQMLREALEKLLDQGRLELA